VRNLRQEADPIGEEPVGAARHQPHQYAEGPATEVELAELKNCSAGKMFGEQLAGSFWPGKVSPEAHERIGDVGRAMRRISGGW